MNTTSPGTYESHYQSALAIRNEILDDQAKSLGKYINTPKPLCNEEQVQRLRTYKWWRVSSPQDLTYTNYLTGDGWGEKPTKTELIKNYLVHRVCMSTLAMEYKKSTCCCGDRIISVVVPGEDLFKSKYDLLGHCDKVSNAFQNLVLLDDLHTNAGFKTDIAFIPFGYTNAVYSCAAEGSVYHTYVVIKENKEVSLIFDGSVSNYRTDKNTFFGTPCELVLDLKDLLKNRTNSYRLFFMPIRPLTMMSKYQIIFRYCIGDQSITLDDAAHDLFSLWYGENMYPLAQTP